MEGNIEKSPCGSDVREEEVVEKCLWEQGDSDIQSTRMDVQRKLRGGVADFLQTKAETIPTYPLHISRRKSYTSYV